MPPEVPNTDKTIDAWLCIAANEQSRPWFFHRWLNTRTWKFWCLLTETGCRSIRSYAALGRLDFCSEMERRVTELENYL